MEKMTDLEKKELEELRKKYAHIFNNEDLLRFAEWRLPNNADHTEEKKCLERADKTLDVLLSKFNPDLIK